MNPQSAWLRILRVSALVCIALLVASCGGGGSTTVIVVPLPGVVLLVTVSPSQVPETGGSVQYTIVVLNDGTEDLTIDDLFDDVYDLDAECPPFVGVVLAPNATYQCVFTPTLRVSGNAASSPFVNHTTVEVSSSGGSETVMKTGSVVLLQELMPNFKPDQPNPVNPGISMQKGAVDDTAFDVRIEVTDIDDFFGAAFQLTFNSNSVGFLDFDTTGSILSGMNPTMQVTALAPGQLAVLASLPQGTAAGLANGDGLLLTLNFNATKLVTGNPFRFPVASRLVEVCPLGQACDEIQGAVNWDEGSLDVE